MLLPALIREQTRHTILLKFFFDGPVIPYLQRHPCAEFVNQLVWQTVLDLCAEFVNQMVWQTVLDLRARPSSTLLEMNRIQKHDSPLACVTMEMTAALCSFSLSRILFSLSARL